MDGIGTHSGKGMLSPFFPTNADLSQEGALLKPVVGNKALPARKY